MDHIMNGERVQWIAQQYCMCVRESNSRMEHEKSSHMCADKQGKSVRRSFQYYIFFCRSFERQ